MRQIRINQEITIVAEITRNGLPEDFSTILSFAAMLVHRTYPSIKITLEHVTSANVVTVVVPASLQAKVGPYDLNILYTKPSTNADGYVPYPLDMPAVELVSKSYQAGGVDECADLQTQVVNISGDVGINRDGKSFFDIWKALYGTDESTESDMIAWNKSEALAAAQFATQTADNIQLAEDGRVVDEGLRKTSESQRKADEIIRQDNEVARGEFFDLAMQESADATGLAIAKAGDAQTAASAADNAASAANAAARNQSIYNVTVSVPPAAGTFYGLAGAIAAVPTPSRSLGLDLKFATAANTWVMYRYKGSDLTGWTTTANWEQVPDAAKLATLETDLNEKLEYKADLVEGTVPAEQLPPDLIRTTLYLTQVGHRKRRIQDAVAVEDGTMLWSIVSGTEYLASLPDTLGLGLYLVSQDLTVYKKLSKTNSSIYEDGTPALLDGSEGDIQMCWRKPIYIKYYEKQETDGLYEHIEISHLNILGECEMITPGGGFPAVLNRTTGDLRALYSTDPNYRGGNNATAYDSDPVKTLIGKPATNLSAYSGEVAAKKRGPLWTTGGTPFFATLAILQIMLFGTNDSQGAIVTDDVLVDGEGFQSCKKDVNKLFSGGFGVSNGFPSWATYNASNPTFDLSSGFTRGDITGRRVYIIKDWPTVGTNQTLSIAYFFGMPYPFNHYWHEDAHQRVDQQTEAQGFKTVVYQKRDITTVPISGGPSLNGVVPSAPWEKVAEASRTEGFIRRTSFNALCLTPTVLGSPGALNRFYPDYCYNNGTTSFGWRAPIRLGNLFNGPDAGAFYVRVDLVPTYANANCGAFCCHFSSGTVPKKITI